MAAQISFVSLGLLVLASALVGGLAGSRYSSRRIRQKNEKSLTREARATSFGSSDDLSDEDYLGDPSSIRDWSMADGPFKLILAVNMDLKMGKGKVVAQCCHATLACYKHAKMYAPNTVKGWEYMGQAKVCLKCPNEEELWAIREKAEAAGLVTYLVMDAGKTQIAPGSRTVLGIGPAPETAFLGITDHLKLM